MIITEKGLPFIADYIGELNEEPGERQVVKSQGCTQPYMTETEARRLKSWDEFERRRV